MPQRIEVGEFPHIEIEHSARDLSVKGLAGTIMKLSGDDPRYEVLREGDTNLVRVMAPGDCSLRAPEASTVIIRQASRDLRVKNIRGFVQIDSVSRDCAIRSVDAVEIGQVAGSLHVKYATGMVTLGSASGDVALRGISGPIRAGNIIGDLYALDIENGAEIENITGDLSVRTAFQTEASYRFGAVSGDAVFRLGTDANVRFVFPADSNARVIGAPEPVIEGEYAIVIFGEGLSEVMIEQLGGDLQITADDADVATFDGDLDTHLSKLAVEVDAKLEETLSGIPYVDADAIRDRVRRKMDRERRRVASKRRDVHCSVSQFGHHTRSQSGGWEPSSEGERLTILQMVEGGKISVEEAEKLLGALEGEEN